MNLFDMNENTRQLPLASRMRPEKLDEIVGQLHIIGKDKLLYRAIKADRLGSIILYGPPGVGKTTIARVIANTTKSYFCKLNATNAGIKDLEKIIEEAKFNQNAYHKGSLNYETFKNEIAQTGIMLKNLIRQRGLTGYKTAGNWAVFTYMTDSLPINNYTPCTYDFDDFICRVKIALDEATIKNSIYTIKFEFGHNTKIFKYKHE